MPVARRESSDARVIAHVDMDCFYVQVEQRRQPDLKGLPTAVIQYNAWQGGGLIAVGYEARKFGVKRSMRGDEAKKVCPGIHLVQVPVARGKANLNVYRNAGSEVVAILSQRGRCERASIDEVYLDLTDAAETMLAENPPESSEGINDEALKSHVLGIDQNGEAEREHVKEWICDKNASHRDKLLACGAIIVGELRLQVLKETEFTCSAGIAHNKMLAKLASPMNKPAQQTVVPYSAVNQLLASLPIKKLKHLGGKLGSSVQTDLGVNTVGDLLQFSEQSLQERYGVNTGTWLWNVARGINGDEVEGRLLPKSHACGKTFPGPQALKTMTSVESWLHDLCEELSERLQLDMDQNNRVAHTLTLHARVYKTNEHDSLKKFPSKSCPLRYGTAKLQEDALKLFNSGLRDFLDSFSRVEAHGHQKIMWGVTGLSVTASKILSTPGTSSILKYFHGKNPSSEKDLCDETTQDTLPASHSRDESCSAGSMSELQESSCEARATNCNKFNLDRDGMKMGRVKNKGSNSILRFFNSPDPSCSSSEQACSGSVQDNLQVPFSEAGSPARRDNCLASGQSEATETSVTSVSRDLCQNEPKKGSLLRFFGTKSSSCCSSQPACSQVVQDHGLLGPSGWNQAATPDQTEQGDNGIPGKQNWSFNVEEIDQSVIDELPPEIQNEVRGWLRPPKRANTTKRGSSIAQYFLPTRDT